MSVEMRPLNVKCNLACTYCYQEPMRQANNIKPKYDVDKMLEEAEKTGQPFHLFGGEALLVPKKDLERFWKRGMELHKSNGIQTNGTLIDDDHIALFKAYNVNVGVSIDGAYDLNGLREVRGKEGDKNATITATEATMNNLRKLVDHDVSVSVIITLHRLNGSKEYLPRLLNFMRWLGDIGIKHGNIHKLEVDKTMPDQERHVLTQEENIEAFLTIAKFLEENDDLRYNPFRNYYDAIVDTDMSNLTCYLNRCDPMNTVAVYGIEGDGALTNCGRTNKEGIDWYKADDISYERYLSLYHTPPEYNGCQGCPYFMVCSGGCPGEAIDGDFRNKTIHCKTMKALLGYYETITENQGKTPWTKRSDRAHLEMLFFSQIEKGESTNVQGVMTRQKARSITKVKVKVKGAK
jgi:uncharacterized protein